jgi:flagellar basal body-associated protein FliL
MDSNEETVQKRVVVNSPGQRSEVLTERTQRGPRESGVSTGTIAIIAILAITAISAVLYIVSNTNANESANRNANLDVASEANSQQAPPTTIIQQPAPAQQAPVIIQQPAQQAPVIIEQPSLRDNASDDANMQEVATKRLGEEMDMTAVSITITDAHAVLTGTVYSAARSAKAEQIVKAVRGVKSVDNKLVVSG